MEGSKLSPLLFKEGCHAKRDGVVGAWARKEEGSLWDVTPESRRQGQATCESSQKLLRGESIKRPRPAHAERDGVVVIVVGGVVAKMYHAQHEVTRFPPSPLAGEGWGEGSYVRNHRRRR